MAHKQHLHQLLKQDQDPFHLQTYIFEKRCQLKPQNSSSQITHNFCNHVFLSPFHQDSQNSAILLPVPALLLEAAMRIEKKQGSHRNRAKMKNFGFGILGSVLNKLKERKNNTRRELGNSRTSQSGEIVEKSSCETSFSCNCYNHNSSISSPFSDHRSPELSSPATSPVLLNKEKLAEGSNNEDGGKHSEQCSPVSVLDTPFEDDNVAGDEDAKEDEFEDNSYDEDDDELECSISIVQETKEKLLDKLRRFEKLAELDPVELGKRMEEEEDSNGEDNNDEAMSLGRYGDLDTLTMTEALSLSSFKHSRMLMSDLIEEENDDKYGFKNKEIMIRRISSRLSSWKEFEPNDIDLMIKLDFEREFDGRKVNVEATEEYREIVKEIEVTLIRFLMAEIACELLNMKCRQKA